MGFLGKTPYLLASLQRPGVLAACIAQFESTEPSGRQRVARWCMGPAHTETLRPEVGQTHDDGGSMSRRLEHAVMSLTWCPMDDCVCEGPHAKATRSKTPASEAKRTWAATSMRLQQNLQQCQGSTSLRASWSSYASVVQPASREGRFPKLRRQRLERQLYRIEHLLQFDLGRATRGRIMQTCPRRWSS